MLASDFKAKRLAMRLSIVELADLLGMSREHVSHFEHGRARIRRVVELAMLALEHELDLEQEAP